MAELVGAKEVGEHVLAVCVGGDTLVEFRLGELDVLCLEWVQPLAGKMDDDYTFAVSKHFFENVVLP